MLRVPKTKHDQDRDQKCFFQLWNIRKTQSICVYVLRKQNVLCFSELKCKAVLCQKLKVHLSHIMHMWGLDSSYDTY